MQVDSVCILGGSGFVGRAIAEALCERGVRVRVLSRGLTRSRALWVLPTVDVRVVNPHDEVALAACFEDIDVVVNLCGILHETRAESFESVHVDLPRKVVGACRAAGVRHLVHMSALAASDAAPSDYLRSKARGEATIRDAAAGLPWTILRPSIIFGADDRFLNMFSGLMSLLPVVPLARANARFQPIWVEDVARAIATVLGNPRCFGQAYELCGPHAYTLRELVEFVAGATQRRRAVIALPDWASSAQAFVLERLPGKLMTRDNLKSMSVDNVCSGGFPDVLGFQPTPLEAIAPRYLADQTARARYNKYRYRAGR